MAEIHEMIAQSSRTSAHQLAKQLCINKCLYPSRTVLHSQALPYKVNMVHQLSTPDFGKCMEYCDLFQSHLTVVHIGDYIYN
jgi:hypothetical protein